MIVRGENRFLIAALAESTGIFASQNDESVSQENDGSESYLMAIGNCPANSHRSGIGRLVRHEVQDVVIATTSAWWR